MNPRRAIDYSAPCVSPPPVVQGAVDVTVPVAGYYRFRLRSDGVRGGVRIWHGPPHDPVTGEELDRSWRWQATMNGEELPFDRVWPACAKDPITEEDYNFLIAKHRWAQEHAPNSALADPRRRNDFFDANAPLPF